jgi:N-acetylglutamate synthase-like GNAT family acetyltransferase
VIEGMPPYSIPVILLARLAVDKGSQESGFGKALLKHAFMQAVAASQIGGVRAFWVHAKDEKAKRWYQRFDFKESQSNPLHLYLLLKDIRASMEC